MEGATHIASFWKACIVTGAKDERWVKCEVKKGINS